MATADINRRLNEETLLIQSGKPGMFIAGADLKELAGVKADASGVTRTESFRIKTMARQPADKSAKNDDNALIRELALLLDETSLGLAPIVVDEIFVAVRRLAAQGLTILVVEQNTALALEVADHGYVLEQGHFAIQGPASSLMADPRVKQAYLGI